MARGDQRGTLTGNGNSVTNPSDLAGSVAVSVGDLIVAVFGQQTNLTASGATDNLGNSYSAQNAGTDPGSPTARTFYSIATVTGTLTAIHIAASASTNDWAGFAGVFEGPITALDVNLANITTDVTSPFTCPATGTLAQPDELVVCWGAAHQSTVWAATSPLLLSGNANNSTNVKVALGRKVVSSTTTTSPEFTAAANPTTAILGTLSFKLGVTQTDGAIAAQAATMAGAALSASLGTGILAAALAAVLGAGLSLSMGTGVLASGASAMSGAGTVENPTITGIGALTAQSAALAGAGASASTGIGSLISSASMIDGDGLGLSTGSGALAAQASTLDSVGLSASSGTGVLAAQASDVLGAGGVGDFPITGTGVISDQAAQLAGAGAGLSAGTGVLSDSASAGDGTGLTASVGLGGMVSHDSALTGSGVSISVSMACDLLAQSATLAGSGVVGSFEITGTGSLVAQAFTLSGYDAMRIISPTAARPSCSMVRGALPSSALISSAVPTIDDLVGVW